MQVHTSEIKTHVVLMALGLWRSAGSRRSIVLVPSKSPIQLLQSKYQI